MDEYYYLDADRKPCGPLSLEKLLEMHAEGALSGDVLAAKVGGEKWQPLRALTPEGRSAGVGPCPKCGVELALQEGELPELCPTCGKRLRPKDFGFLACVYSAFAQYASFKGRATRAEYWWFYLFTVIISFPLSILAEFAAAAATVANPSPALVLLIGINTCFALGTFLPSLAVTVRRLHDVGRSGWWLVLVPALYVGLLFVMGVAISLSIAHGNRVALYTLSALGIILCVSLLVLVVLLCVCLLSDSRRGSNPYGPSSKYPQ